MSDVEPRLAFLHQRLRTSYESIGHSSGRPYIYFVYPPAHRHTLELYRLVDLELHSGPELTFYHLDVLPIVLRSTAGQESRREELLSSPTTSQGAAGSLLRLWARAVRQAITTALEAEPARGRPVVVLRGLAALHPLGTPTGLMEVLAEQEPRDPRTEQIVPIILLVPGIRPPQSSRTYLFLGLEALRLDFYRGEEA